jgi:hypothetical protein
MIGYSERNYFSSPSVAAYRQACALVDRVSSHTSSDGCELRCYELARAVAQHLVMSGFTAEVVDGKMWWFDHTWILLSGQEDAALLDVYVPGRIPQVQLIHDHSSVSRGYERWARPRTDIRHAVVDELTLLMDCKNLIAEEAVVTDQGLIGRIAVLNEGKR